MKSLAMIFAVLALSGCIVAPYDSYRAAPRGSVYMDRDRDGDGIPNRYDRRPNNPYRY